MDRFDRRSFTQSERATLDVCYHHLTLVRSTENAKGNVELLTEYRERMTRSLNHMVRNRKIEQFEVICDWSNNSTGDIENDEINMEIQLFDKRLFPAHPVKLKLHRSYSAEALEKSQSKNDALEAIWSPSLPQFPRTEVERWFRNFIILDIKPYWNQLRNTQDGRQILVRVINGALEKLHSNLMIDHGESTIKCHEFNTMAKPGDAIKATAVTESRQGQRYQLDVTIVPQIS